MTNEQQWAETEKGLRAVLGDGVTTHAMEWILADLRPRWLEMLAKSPPVPIFERPETKPTIEGLFHRNSLNALVQMVRLERELYEAKFGCSVVPSERQAEWEAARMPEPEPGARVN